MGLRLRFLLYVPGVGREKSLHRFSLLRAPKVALRVYLGHKGPRQKSPIHVMFGTSASQTVANLCMGSKPLLRASV